MNELNDAQLEVARCIARGMSDKVIAARLRVGRDRIRQLINQIAILWSIDPANQPRPQIAYLVGRSDANKSGVDARLTTR